MYITPHYTKTGKISTCTTTKRKASKTPPQNIENETLTEFLKQAAGFTNEEAAKMNKKMKWEFILLMKLEKDFFPWYEIYKELQR